MSDDLLELLFDCLHYVALAFHAPGHAMLRCSPEQHCEHESHSDATQPKCPQPAGVVLLSGPMKSIAHISGAAQCWEAGLYQYLSSQVRLAAGSDYAKPSTLSLMRAQNSASGRNATMHGPSEPPPAVHSIKLYCQVALPSHPEAYMPDCSDASHHRHTAQMYF